MKKIATFYRPEMSLPDNQENFSSSPQKPRRMMEYLHMEKLDNFFEIKDFEAFTREDFYLAHEKQWVDDVYEGTGRMQRRTILGLKWSRQFADTLPYTNASLYHAIRHSVIHPDEVVFSPTSGFHHAIPRMGALFCTFSGQVIASLKIYHEFGLKGAWVDLDGHSGDSIELSYDFAPDLEKAVPRGIGNINIHSSHDEYLMELEAHLDELGNNILSGKIDYVVFCHGADSHEWDDLGHQLNTEEWLQCSEMFYTHMKQISMEQGKPVPLSLSLFGGYRKDDFDSVLSLHTADLVQCLNIIYGYDIDYEVAVRGRG